MYMYVEQFTCACVKLWHVHVLMIIKLKHFNIIKTFIVSMSLPWVCIIQLIQVPNIWRFTGLLNDSNMSGKKLILSVIFSWQANYQNRLKKPGKRPLFRTKLIPTASNLSKGQIITLFMRIQILAYFQFNIWKYLFTFDCYPHFSVPVRRVYGSCRWILQRYRWKCM